MYLRERAVQFTGTGKSIGVRPGRIGAGIFGKCTCMVHLFLYVRYLPAANREPITHTVKVLLPT